MKLFNIIATSVLAFSISSTAMANTQSPHSVGIQIGGGAIDYKNNDSDHDSVATSYVYYNYKFAPHYYAEVGMLGGADIDWDCDKNADGWDCYSDHDKKNTFNLDADELDISALVLALKTDLSLSKRNTLYGKVGATYFNYDISLDKNKFADESGVGLMLEGGWEYRWDMGIGMNASLQYLKMDDLESKAMNIGISYSF